MHYNRDLSWLGFNHRVLMEAADASVPLLERLKFLAIFSSNLDEFFRVRYPAVVALSKLGKKTLKKQSLLSESDIANTVQTTIGQQLNEFGQILNQQLLPALKDNNIYFYYNEPILPQHQAELKEIFYSKVLSFIQPVFLGSEVGYNFMPQNNELYFVVSLRDLQHDKVQHVAINIPSKKLKRLFTLSKVDGKEYVIFIDDIIRQNVHMLFPGKQVQSVYSIKFNRNAELTLNDDYSTNILEKIEKKLSSRDTGSASRLLYEKGMPASLQLFLGGLFKVDVADMFEGGRYHNLSDLFSFPVNNLSLSYPKDKPILYPASAANGEIFETIVHKDVLLHLPYHSYAPVLSFFNQAAIDADVTDIYITLYRVAAESHIVNALISAAKNGKNVTAFIELKARFDEANNIKWSRVMKKAGVKLVYSDPAVKVHSKIALVKKKVNGSAISYAVLSTGNFNETTASFYTDHVLFTARHEVCAELEQLFNFLSKQKQDPAKAGLRFREIYVAKFNLLSDFEKLVNAEIKKARKGLDALVRIKVNNLEDPDFIDILYKASQAGVKVELIVRSICAIVPGLQGISENITVRRIVDKYLEHTRLFIFGTGSAAKVIMGSSDLMIRNLRRRIEVCIEVKDEIHRKQLLDYFDMQWNDDVKAFQLDAEMNQVRVPSSGRGQAAQLAISNYIQNIST